MGYIGVYRGYIGKMEKKMETTIMGWTITVLYDDYDYDCYYCHYYCSLYRYFKCCCIISGLTVFKLAAQGLEL